MSSESKRSYWEIGGAGGPSAATGGGGGDDAGAGTDAVTAGIFSAEAGDGG